MQTFLPLPGFQASAATLDYKRLGKQRVETKQILRALLPEPLRALLPPRPPRRPPESPRERAKPGWVDHPAVTMWRGYEGRLALYGRAVCLEWRRRGYRDSILPQFVALIDAIGVGPAPPWLGDPALHASHRSALLRKLPAHYARFGRGDLTRDSSSPSSAKKIDPRCRFLVDPAPRRGHTPDQQERRR